MCLYCPVNPFRKINRILMVKLRNGFGQSNHSIQKKAGGMAPPAFGMGKFDYVVIFAWCTRPSFGREPVYGQKGPSR